MALKMATNQASWQVTYVWRASSLSPLTHDECSLHNDFKWRHNKKCTHNSILFIDFIIKKMLPPADIFPTKLLHSADIVSVNEWLGLCQKRFDGRI